MDKVTKITGIQKLHLRKDLLKKQIYEQEQALDEHFSYLQHHLGPLVVNAAMSSVQENLPPGIRSFLSPFISRKEKSIPVSANSHESPGQPAGKGMKIMQMLGSALPLVVDLAMPIIMGMGVKFLKKKFLKK